MSHLAVRSSGRRIALAEFIRRWRSPTADGSIERRQWVYGWLTMMFGIPTALIGVLQLVADASEGWGWLAVGIACLIGLPLGLRGHTGLVVATFVTAILLGTLVAIVRAPANPAAILGLVVVLVTVSVTESTRTTVFVWGLSTGVALLPLLARDPAAPELPVGSNLQSRVALVLVVGVLAVGGSHFSQRVLDEVRGRNRRNRRLTSELTLVLETLELQVRDRTEALAERTREFERITTELDDSIAREEALAEQMRRLAETDDLTGLTNRRGFMAILDRALRRGGWLALADLDHFKTINDTFGHAVGDHVLHRVSQQLAALAPAGGTVCRIGGEEFAILLPDPPGRRLSQREVFRVVDGLVRAVRGLQWSSRIKPGLQHWRVTVSIGAAPFEPVGAPGPGVVSELLRRADRELYKAKDAGRDRAVLSSRPVGGPTDVPSDGTSRASGSGSGENGH